MAGRLTLAQQLKQLEDDSDVPFGGEEIDNGDLALDGLSIPKDREGGREHYLEVGPSRLRNGAAAQSLLGDKYGGEVRGRMKIFDDDEDEDEEEEGEDENRAFGEVESDEEDDDDDGEEDGEDDEDEEEVDEGQGEDDDEEEGEEEEQLPMRADTSKLSKVLDPMAALKDARAKDIEKGKAIKLQKKLFEDVLTLRITFQKAWTASLKLPQTLPSSTDPEPDIDTEKVETLRKLSDLSESLFELRSNFPPLPGAPAELLTRKRKRPEGDEVLGEEYWESASKDSLALAESSRPAMNSILEKWSNKIQVATMQLGGKGGAGSSKFIQSTKGQMGILEAIEAGLSSKRDSDKTFEEHEDASYRALLREVIESRAGGGAGPDLTHLRKEKKKKREEERGGSKGRKIRYTVHEKAQNFVVPIPLSHGWHEEQVDELFSSLFGGVGLSGATSEAVVPLESAGAVEGLGGLRVF